MNKTFLAADSYRFLPFSAGHLENNQLTLNIKSLFSFIFLLAQRGIKIFSFIPHQRLCLKRLKLRKHGILKENVGRSHFDFAFILILRPHYRNCQVSKKKKPVRKKKGNKKAFSEDPITITLQGEKGNNNKTFL